MIKAFILFLRALYKSRALLLQLTVRDFKTRYLGSFLGLLWAVIQPVCTVCIFWFVFQVGFKAAPVDNFPFILWLIAGIVPWFYISECLATGTNAIAESSYLVKKVVFRVSTLPLVKLLSALVIHLFFLGITFVLFFAYGYPPTIHAIQLIYYVFLLTLFLLGVIWITASLMVFLKDIGQLIALFLQFGFWMTPIFWSIQQIPPRYQLMLKLNPFYYIVQGFRDSLIYHVWFWEHPKGTLYFWTITIVAFLGGALVFTRLRPHFADVM